MSQAELKTKAAQLLHWMNNPVICERQKEVLSEKYFDIQDQLKLAA